MASRRSRNGSNGSRAPLVTALTVKGFKSIAKEQRMEIRPLTILAGANSSGKSSMMQPALLIKQTLESPFDPGALLINGPNVKMTEFGQMFWGTGTRRLARTFEVGFEDDRWRGALQFGLRRTDLEVLQISTEGDSGRRVLRPGASQEQLHSIDPHTQSLDLDVVRERCFLRIRARDLPFYTFDLAVTGMAGWFAQRLIHLPRLRSSVRIYPRAAVGELFPGTFDDYFASVLNHWKRHDRTRLLGVSRTLEKLELTWIVDVREVGATGLEILVGRLAREGRAGSRDLVNLADVGFGTAQALPVIVALWAAKPGDTVYIEQPELHLHPRAQATLASVLANAAKRGVRVIAETHSSLLLLGIQTVVAEGKLRPDLVKLHWFTRSEKDGATTVSSTDLDRNGAFGDWPEDFDDVALDSQQRYLDAGEHRSRRR